MSVSLDLIVLGLPVHDPAWIAAVGGLITACGGVAGGAIGALGAMLHGRKHTDAKLEVIKGLAAEAKEQTANNHGTNLRDDLDETRAKVDQISELATSTNGLVRQLGGEIAGIRRDLSAMRDRQSNEERAHTVLVESSKPTTSASGKQSTNSKTRHNSLSLHMRSARPQLLQLRSGTSCVIGANYALKVPNIELSAVCLMHAN